MSKVLNAKQTFFKYLRVIALSVFAPLLVVLAASTLTAGTASASHTRCSHVNLCFFYDINYGGLYTEYYNPYEGCHNFSSTFNNQVSSYDNNVGGSITLYDATNCSLWTSKFFGGGVDHPDLPGFNDKASSYYLDY